MIEINLIPDVKQELIKAQRVRAKVIAGSIIVGLVSVATVTALILYVFTVQTVRSSYADEQIKQGNKELSNIEDLSKILTIQNQLTKMSNLNSQKKIDSRIFALEAAIKPPAPNDVDITNLVVDSAQNTITIDGKANNSYAAIEVLRKTIEAAEIKYTGTDGKQQSAAIASDVRTTNASYSEDISGVKLLRFTISFVYAPELFSPASKDATISIVNRGNVTDSYLGLPKSIFADDTADTTGGEQ